MQIVAGLSVKNLHPRVWDPHSPYYLPDLRAVMVSYADFHQNPVRRRRAMEEGLHAALGVPRTVAIYLDNGAFYFSTRSLETDADRYQEFACEARPDWMPISQDFIPAPTMNLEAQRECLARTMAMNRRHAADGYVPVIHVSRVLPEYIAAVRAEEWLAAKPWIALGGIVPNLLRAPKAMAYADILGGLREVRSEFAGKQFHVFGMGGTATAHLAALLGIDSLDSSGWRNRAARGIVQLLGSGDRVVAELGKWRGRRASEEEWERLMACACPPCREYGADGLKRDKLAGFCHRATHNLWVLLQEARWIDEHLRTGTYAATYRWRLDNSIYLPLIEQVLQVAEVFKPA